jgi:hypothetical protein
VFVNYAIWVGDNVDVSYSRIFPVPFNSTFYQVMTIAASLDARYVFSAQNSSVYGHFITSIGNNAQNPASNLYWFIYVLDKRPNVNKKPGSELLSQFGVDNFNVTTNNSNYLFWLRTWNPSSGH